MGNGKMKAEVIDNFLDSLTNEQLKCLYEIDENPDIEDVECEDACNYLYKALRARLGK